jgi:hypothetical protein
MHTNTQVLTTFLGAQLFKRALLIQYLYLLIVLLGNPRVCSLSAPLQAGYTWMAGYIVCPAWQALHGILAASGLADAGQWAAPPLLLPSGSEGGEGGSTCFSIRSSSPDVGSSAALKTCVLYQALMQVGWVSVRMLGEHELLWLGRPAGAATCCPSSQAPPHTRSPLPLHHTATTPHARMQLLLGFLLPLYFSFKRERNARQAFLRTKNLRSDENQSGSEQTRRSK